MDGPEEIPYQQLMNALLTDMKTNDLPFDEMADSMTNAAARMGIPLDVLKAAKRSGSLAFRAGRVNLTQLREDIASAAKGPRTSGVLLIVEEVARIIASRLPHGDAKFRADSRKLTEMIHNGFGAALCIVEPDSVDDFLSKSAALMENIFKSDRQKLSRVGSTKKRQVKTLAASG